RRISRSMGLGKSPAPSSRQCPHQRKQNEFDRGVNGFPTGYSVYVRSKGIGGVVRDVGWLVIPAVCLVALMVLVGYLVTDVWPSSAFGKWDADIPRRLLEYRQPNEVSETKFITMLSATPTI